VYVYLCIAVPLLEPGDAQNTAARVDCLSKIHKSCFLQSGNVVFGRESLPRQRQKLQGATTMLVVICCWTTSAAQGRYNILGIVSTLNRLMARQPGTGDTRNLLNTGVYFLLAN
jgi:hypothetical protein